MSKPISRPSIDRYLLGIAIEVSKRSTCTKNFGVGAVASRDGRILMTGYNGVPSGLPHCDEVGCVRLEDGKHAYLLHAEENLVAQACKYGVSLDGMTVHITHFPCSHCAAILVQAGVRCVVFAGYRDDSSLRLAWRLFEQAGVAVYQYMWVEGVTRGLEEVLKEIKHEKSIQASRTAGLGNAGPEAGHSGGGQDDVLGHGR